MYFGWFLMVKWPGLGIHFHCEKLLEFLFGFFSSLQFLSFWLQYERNNTLIKIKFVIIFYWTLTWKRRIKTYQLLMHSISTIFLLSSWQLGTNYLNQTLIEWWLTCAYLLNAFIGLLITLLQMLSFYFLFIFSLLSRKDYLRIAFFVAVCIINFLAFVQ